VALSTSAENDQPGESPGNPINDDAASALLDWCDSAFIENTGREVESALGSILDLVGRLQDDSTGIGELTTEIWGRGEGLRRIFRSMKHLGRLSGDRADRDPEEVDVADLAQELFEDAKPAAREKELGLTLKAPPSPVEMNTDTATLRQTLEHLLANVVMFASQTEITLHVDVEDSEVAFRVKDTGTGAPADDLPSLVEPLARGASEEPDPSSPGERLGLNLTLLQALSRHLEGSFEAKGDPEEGSILTLRVPRDLASAVHGKPKEEDEHESAHLLVVEDNDVTRRLLRKMLQEVYRVDMAEEAGEAIRKAEERAYDAFVLDVNLKDRRTGVEVLQAVRKMEGYVSVPAVACTAYALDDHREHFLRAGFDDVVAKPVTKRKILDVIDRRLGEPSSSEVGRPDVSLSGIELPPIPTTLIEVAGLASDSDSPDVDALTEALQKDAVVSQWLIRHINSAYYSLRESIDTVERAVRYLGFKPVCNLVLTKVIGESFSGTDEPEGEQVQQYIMKTSMLTAFTARALSEEIGFESPELAYTGGIFAQIGRLVLLEEEGRTYVDLWFEDLDRSASFQGPPPQGREIIHFEEDYVQNGLAVGEACGLSDKLNAVLWGHHRPGRGRDRFRTLVLIVGLAFKVAHHAEDLGVESPWGGSETLASDLRSFRATRLLAKQGPVSEQKLVEKVVEIVEDAQEFVAQTSFD
jgi:two-component system aerobic respiration control sensor histidine kinase ArcB